MLQKKAIPHGFDVLFDRPVILEANKEYKVKSFIKGPPMERQKWANTSGVPGSAIYVSLFDG